MLGITSLIAPNGRTAMKAPRVSFSPALTTTLSCNTGHRADAGFQYVPVPFMAGSHVSFEVTWLRAQFGTIFCYDGIVIYDVANLVESLARSTTL